MKNTDIAYLAGILDGEGTISVHKDKNGHCPIVSISGTNLDMLEWCKSVVGLPATICKKKTYSKKHNQAYELRWRYVHANNVIKEVYPYLRIKKSVAVAVFAFGKLSRRNGKYSKKEKEEIVFAIRLIRELNSRGVPSY